MKQLFLTLLSCVAVSMIAIAQTTMPHVVKEGDSFRLPLNNLELSKPYVMAFNINPDSVNLSECPGVFSFHSNNGVAYFASWQDGRNEAPIGPQKLAYIITETNGKREARLYILEKPKSSPL